MRFTIQTGLKANPFEIHHGGKQSTELSNINKDDESYLSDWKTMTVSVLPKQNPIYVEQNEKRDVTDHSVITRKKNFLPVHPTKHQRENR